MGVRSENQGVPVPESGVSALAASVSTEEEGSWACPMESLG